MGEEAWIKNLISASDMPVIIAIAVINYFLWNAKSVPNWVSIAAPLVMGGLYGVQLALEANYSFGSHVTKGMYINGGSALVVSYLVHRGKERFFPDAPSSELSLALHRLLREAPLVWHTQCMSGRFKSIVREHSNRPKPPHALQVNVAALAAELALSEMARGVVNTVQVQTVLACLGAKLRTLELERGFALCAAIADQCGRRGVGYQAALEAGKRNLQEGGREMRRVAHGA